MKLSPDQDYAVITGDIVASTRLSPAARRQLASELKRISDELTAVFRGAVPLPLEQFRGDGWQLLVADPGRSLRVALFIRARLRASALGNEKIDTRMAIGVGRVTLLPGRRLGQGDGEAFRLSGPALDALREPLRLALAWPDRLGPVSGAVAAFAPALDAIVQGWTPVQARAVAERLKDLTQRRIARRAPAAVSRQAVARALRRAGWPALSAALTWMEESNLWRLHS